MSDGNVTFSIKLDSLLTSCVSFRRLASTDSGPAGGVPKKPGRKPEDRRQESL